MMNNEDKFYRDLIKKFFDIYCGKAPHNYIKCAHSAT